MTETQPEVELLQEPLGWWRTLRGLPTDRQAAREIHYHANRLVVLAEGSRIPLESLGLSKDEIPILLKDAKAGKAEADRHKQLIDEMDEIIDSSTV